MTASTRDIPGTTQAPEAGDLDEATGLSRRKVFAMCSLGVLGAAGLAACSSGSSDGAGAPTSTTAGAAPATTAAAAPAASASAGSDGATSAPAVAGGADSTTAPAGSGGTVLTKLSAVPVGGAISLSVGGKPVIVSQPTTGKAAAFSAICPHQGATVAVTGGILRCPLHGSTFQEATGKNISGPAAGRPLTPLHVSVSGGNVVLGA